MKCEQWKPLLAGYMDGELTREENERFKKHLSHCTDCREDLLQLGELKEVTDHMKHEHLPDAFWDQYWLGVYNRMERGLAWVLLSIGGAILVGFGMWQLVTHLFLDADVPLLLRFGVGITIAGSAVLFVSLIRERMRMWRHDLYKEVQR
jgi:predicted anti-sigma-YlaC factor YlaD